MDKSPDAFRTISEVAEWLDTPTHVLRFWESRFSQIKPVKRAGGRRYYRPSDMRLIGGVKVMLHDQGMTIRSVQKTLREQGIKHVAGFSPPLDTDAQVDDEDDVIEGTATENVEVTPAPAPAARSTYGAQPAPVDDEEDDDDDDDLGELITEGLLDDDEPALDLPPAETATPDVDETPVDVEPEPVAEPPQGDPVPMFRRTSTRPPQPVDEAPPVETEAPEPVADPEPEPVAETNPIPPTPDVPDTDPMDDDPAYGSDAGAAARIVAMRKRDLRAHPEAVAAARDRLREIRARLG